MFFNKPNAGSNKPRSVPAPIGGLNARDSLVAMQETDAVVLKNWWPQPYGCSIRQGYVEQSSGLPSSVQTIATWSSASGGRAMFAWSGTAMYDVTTAGPVGAAVVTTLTNALWETVNIVNAAGNNLICVNGIDDGIIYKGSGAPARIVAGDGITVNTWAGLGPKNAVQLTNHQHRLWAVQINSASGWFLPPDAIQGTFLKYDFGPLFTRGGYLAFLTTWTVDDGSGAEDHLVAMSSEGEVAVYGGTDPTDDTKWFLVGVYFVGAPVAGRRGYCKAGGDLFLLTKQGIVSLAAQITSTKIQQADSKLVSDKIRLLFSDLINEYGDLTGWDLHYYAGLNMLLTNVPSRATGANIQLAQNTIVQAWTQFTGMDAACWGSFAGLPYFGGYDGKVWRAWSGNNDAVLIDGSSSTGIISEAQQAYSYLGAGGVQKQVGFYRPSLVVAKIFSYNSAVLYDFGESALVTPGLSSDPSASVWDTARWDSGRWDGTNLLQRDWICAEGVGVAASIAMVAQTDSEVLWVSTDYSFIQGTGLF